ncbi:16S rRNA (guanine(527)-N(7))-methyltransferase RsmG [Lichenicoccus sp.]|uniref:16S rRNA (guanine(527)-N(7))-methyltransferase RsmG n=1 Tax=Lichenicoccus sp. TaxID=2781899 RepID=UPI003D136186
MLKEDVSEAVIARLTVFADLLTRWNSRINLVAPSDLDQLWDRHIADCVQLFGLIARHEAVTDLGSGAGFPGLIMAICGCDGVTLVEADGRKCSFLREAARASGVHVTIVNSRIEDARLPAADVVTARALAPLPRLLDWAQPLLTGGGRCLFLKGRKAEEELTAVRSRWHMMVARTQSRTDPDGVILSLSQIRRVAPMNC